MSDRPLFHIEDLRFAYPDKFELAIDRLDINPGAVTVLIGENASGKTTLLKLLNGLLRPGAGTLAYDGAAGRATFLSRVRRDCVLVHQDPYLFTGTVFQNVAYGLKVRKTPRPVIRDRVARSLTMLGLEGAAHRRASELSGGERQRVAIARAAVLDPKVLLLDEPTANIDRQSIGYIERLLLSLKDRGAAAVVSSHHRGFAYRVCDNIVLLEEGRVVPHAVNVLKGETTGHDDSFTYFRTGSAALRCPVLGAECGTAAIALEDVILAEEAVHTNAQNCFRGTVTRIEKENGRLRVTVDCGFPLAAYVSPMTGLSPERGQALHVSFKASAVRLY